MRRPDFDVQRSERLATAEQLNRMTDRQTLFELLETWGTWWRDVLLVQAGCGELCSNIDEITRLTQQASVFSIHAVQQYLRTLDRVEGYLHHTVNTRLALEVLLLRAPTLETNQLLS